MKEYTTPTIAIRLCNAAWLLEKDPKIIVTLKGNMTLTMEAPRFSIVGSVLFLTLTQAETAALGAVRVKAEVTMALENGFAAKSPTMGFTIHEAVRKEPA